MYNTETPELFHVFNHASQTWEYRNLSWDKLVGKIHHSMSRIGCNKNDTSCYSEYHYSAPRYVEDIGYVPMGQYRKVYEIRDLWVMDSYGRIVGYDVIKAAVEEYNKEIERSGYKTSYWNWRSRYHFEFRREPVPFIGRRRHTRYYRRTPARTGTLAKLREYPEFMVGYRLTLESIKGMWWDDYPPRTIQRSWKEQGKHRHQWE